MNPANRRVSVAPDEAPIELKVRGGGNNKGAITQKKQALIRPAEGSDQVDWTMPYKRSW